MARAKLQSSVQADHTPVSNTSCWNDEVWVLENATAGSDKSSSAVYWDFELPDGSRLTQPHRAYLLESCRQFVWSLMTNRVRGKPFKVGTIARLTRYLRYFVRWMVEANYRAFDELDPPALDEFLKYLTADKVGSRLGDSLPAKSLVPFISIPMLMLEQAPILSSRGVACPDYVPFRGRSTRAVSRELAPDTIGFIPPVPDEVFLPTTAQIIVWLEQVATDVVALQKAYLTAYERSDAKSESPRLKAGQRALLRFSFSLSNPFASVWMKGLTGRDPSGYLRHLVEDVRNACVMAIQAFIGMRISEVCGLQAYPVDAETGLPACLEIRTSQSGLNEIFYIKGRTYKSSDPWEEAWWVAGSRPKGTDYLPPPVQAVKILLELLRPWRDLGERSELIVSLSANRGLPKRSSSIGPIPAEQLNLGQKDWISKYVTLPASHADWKVSTHQWRKSFALYVVRTDSRMLRAVSQHFKHVSLAMTEQGYLGNDAELLGIMQDTATSETTRILYELCTGRTRAGGRLAQLIQERETEIMAKLTGKSEDEQMMELEDLVRANDLRVWSCDWGWCLFRPETARCTAHLGQFQLQARTPDLSTRNPNPCCRCANLAVTPDHAPFWQARREQWRRALQDYRRTENEAAVLVAEDRCRQSETVLRMMGCLEIEEEQGNGQA